MSNKQRPASLFFAVLDIDPTSPGILLTFARDNPALSPERRTWVRAGPPVFAEDLQALTLPLRSPLCFRYRHIANCHTRETLQSSAVLCRRKVTAKYAIVN
jgi:hypothetical protein